MKRSKKLLSAVFAVALVFGSAAALPQSARLFSLTASAAETEGDWQYTVNEDGETVTLSKYNGTDAEVAVPATLGGLPVTVIGTWVFEDCTTLTSVTFPDSVTEIREGAFYNCTSLEEIVVGKSNENYLSADGVLFNKDKTELLLYPAAKKNTSYEIPEGVTVIDVTAFSDCTSLVNVTLPDSLKVMGMSAFLNCTSLESVTIPDGITAIGMSVFRGCTSLTNVTIPESVTQIDSSAFKDCPSLKITYGGTKAKWEAIEDRTWGSDNYLTDVEIICTDGIINERETDDPAATPGGSDKQEILEATLKNIDSEKGVEGAALDKLLFGDSGWTWNEVEKVEFTSDKPFSVQFFVDNDGWKTLGEEAARAETDGKWSTEWTLNASEMAKDKKYAKVIAKDDATEVKATVYIRQGAEKPSDGKDQQPTGIALAIAPAVLAASAAVVALSKKKK